MLRLPAIYHFKIAHALPLNEVTNYTDLAARTRLTEPNLRRILRHAMLSHIFHEPSKNMIAHTAASRLLVEDAQLQAWIGLHAEDFWLPAAKTLDAMENWPGSQEPTQTGFSLANETDEPMFVTMGKDEKRYRRFGEAMKSSAKGRGLNLSTWWRITRGTSLGKDWSWT